LFFGPIVRVAGADVLTVPTQKINSPFQKRMRRETNKLVGLHQ
jgi:hypothetical protein